MNICNISFLKRFFAILLALSLLFSAGCSLIKKPEESKDTTVPSVSSQATSETPGTTTTTPDTTTTAIPAEPDIEAIRAALSAELALDSAPKKIVDITRYGDYLFIFCDPILSGIGREGWMNFYGGWLFRYNLKTNTLERHYEYLPLSRYVILSETSVVGEGGRLAGFKPFLPQVYELTFLPDGILEYAGMDISKNLMVHTYSTYFRVGRGFAGSSWYTSPCRLKNAYADATSLSVLYERRVLDGTEIDPSAAWEISFSDSTMTILFEDTEPGDLSLGSLALSNIFFESSELTQLEGKTAIKLKLTKYAAYFTINHEYVISPETFSQGQYRYTVLRITFTAGTLSDTDYTKWNPPDEFFEDYLNRTGAVLVTLPPPDAKPD